MKHCFSLAAALAATFSCVLAAGPTCGGGAKCPSDTPCCSSYGQCGVGAYCLGGCDPQNSFDLKSCVPGPTCQSKDYKLNSLNDIVANTKYLGDASSANWVSSGIPLAYSDSVLLTMAPNTVGTLLSSTHYVWYGKISATLSTSQGAGVVTAFILMSDVKDEIDFEFVGVDLGHAQSNYYFQGITNYGNEQNLTVSDTQANLHTYTVDWSPDQITWAIDGNVMRTVKKSDTFNTTDNTYHYPQSPARIQLSLWPAGLQSNGQGTIDWSGGLVDWNSKYMQNGYYYARVTDVNVQCYNPPSGYKNGGNAVYYYTDAKGTQDTVATGGNTTILSSFYATGDNPYYCPVGCSAPGSTQTTTASAVSMSATPETVPGISGGGARGDTSSSGDTSSGSSGSSGSSSGSSSSGSSGSSSFDQGLKNTSTGDATRVAGSAVALIGFFIAALLL